MSGEVWLLLPSLDGGGAERVFVNLSNHLTLRGLPVRLVVLHGGGPLRDEIAPGVEVLDLKVKRVRYAAWRLAMALRRERPAAVLTTLDHLNLLVGLICRFFPRTRFYCRETAIPSLVFRRERWPEAFEALCRISYPAFRAIVCQSTSVADDLKSHYLGPQARLRLIHNPVDSQRVRALAAEGDPFEGEDRVILAVGRFAPQKRFHLLPDLLRKVLTRTRARLHVLGDGPLRPAVEDAFRRAGLESDVKFWGVQKNPYRFMRHARMLVLVSAYEGFPNVVIEANACGIPALVFRCPGVTEEVLGEGKNGHLIESDDLDVMAARAADILDGRAAFPAAAQWVEKRFGIEAIALQYASLLIDDAIDPSDGHPGVDGRMT